MHWPSAGSVMLSVLRLPALWRTQLPGVLLAVTVALAAQSLSAVYGAPAMLLALLLGMALNFLSVDARLGPGLLLAARGFLRFGVVLLGLRLSTDSLLAFGWPPLLLVVTTVLLTLLAGLLVARLCGESPSMGVLTGGAVAICGASAAMAIGSVLRPSATREQEVLFTVAAVTGFSTLAMVVYPLLCSLLQLEARSAGVFIGASVHDVAQVIGAGYSVSEETGLAATFIKMLRVAMLLPVVLLVALINQPAKGAGYSLPLPGFLLGFVAMVAVNALLPLPPWLIEWAENSSTQLLLTAIAGLGIGTSWQSLATVGWRPVVMVAAETLWLAAMVLLAVLWWQW